MPPSGLISIKAPSGIIMEVSAEGVWRITHAVPDDNGDPLVCVDYDGGEQETGETVARLLTDLAAEKVVLIRLTAPDASAVYLNPASVTAVQGAVDGVDAEGALSVVIVAGHRQAVVETPAEVLAALGIEHPSGQS